MPFQGASLLDRDAARPPAEGARVRGRLGGRRARSCGALALAQRAARAICRRSSATGSRRARPTSRGSSRLAEEFDDGERTVRRVRRRRCASASARAQARGVHLLTLPPREGARVGGGVPAAARGEGAAEPARPRRRAGRGAAAALRRPHPRAKRQLLVTWSGRPSRFLAELGVRAAAPPGGARRPKPKLEQTPGGRSRSRSGGSHGPAPRSVPAVRGLQRPHARRARRARAARRLAELAAVPGIGPAKLERYGAELLQQLVPRRLTRGRARPAGPTQSDRGEPAVDESSRSPAREPRQIRARLPGYRRSRGRRVAQPHPGRGVRARARRPWPPNGHGRRSTRRRADRSSRASPCGSRRTAAAPASGSRLRRSSARGSVSGRSRPCRISSSSTPPSRPPYVV